MGKNNTSSRGFGSKAKREFRIELFDPVPVEEAIEEAPAELPPEPVEEYIPAPEPVEEASREE